MFKNILLAVDGSAYTDAVLSHGIELAKALGSNILVLTVADIRIFEWASAVGADGFISIIPSGTYQDESRQLLDEKCDKLLEKCAERLAKEKVNFETQKLIGSPVDLIVEQSQITDLLILGKRGEFARWDNRALGVTVEAVSRNVHKPLLVCKSQYRPIKKILIGYDGSNHANCALQYLGHIAEALKAPITVMCVSEDQETGRHCCQEAEAYLSHYKIELDYKVIPGHPDEIIVHYAQTNQFDLIGIGAYGHSRIREAILGSTTEHILLKSPCSVLLAK